MTSWKSRAEAALQQPQLLQRWGCAACGVMLAVMLRLILWDFETADFAVYSGPWQDYIITHGGWRALRDNFGNYTPPYLYLLVIGTYLPLSKLYVVKLISLPLDFLLAFWVMRVAGVQYRSTDTRLLIFLAVLFVPTTFFNSSLWGQTDAGYTTLLLATTYYFLRERPKAALVCYGFAFAVKLQAIFFAPVIAILLLWRCFKLRHLLILPLPYVLCCVPAWLIGRPILSLLGTYVEQATWSDDLTKNAANLYQWLPNDKTLGDAGMIFAAALAGLFCFAVTRRRVWLTPLLLTQVALLSTLLLPYTLPRMHERYFFAADIFALVYALLRPRRFFVPVIVCGVSLFSYFPYLFNNLTPFSLGYLAVPLGAVLLLTAWDVAQEVRQQQSVIALNDSANDANASPRPALASNNALTQSL